MAKHFDLKEYGSMDEAIADGLFAIAAELSRSTDVDIAMDARGKEDREVIQEADRVFREECEELGKDVRLLIMRDRLREEGKGQ